MCIRDRVYTCSRPTFDKVSGFLPCKFGLMCCLIYPATLMDYPHIGNSSQDRNYPINPNIAPRGGWIPTLLLSIKHGVHGARVNCTGGAPHSAAAQGGPVGRAPSASWVFHRSLGPAGFSTRPLGQLVSQNQNLWWAPWHPGPNISVKLSLIHI